MNLAGLPDFRTESTHAVTPPQWLLNNPGTRVVSKPKYTVADYLIEWQSDWVRRFGIDGFASTPSNMWKGSVAALKTARDGKPCSVA
ncbi:hypothetical protein HND97_18865 [Vibrio cholerae]|nr:hypothetical protein HND97_18865 [Vibrio cholerae]